MNLLKPTLLQALARDYALGTMRGGARRRFDRLLVESADARSELARWQEELATLAAVVPPLQPRDHVWQGLTQRLGLVSPLSAPAPSPAPWWQRLWGGALAGAFAGVLACTVLLQANPQWLGHEMLREDLPASYVGLLSDAAGKPAVLLSSRRQGRVLTAKMLQALPPPAGQVGMLWAFPKSDAKGGGSPFLVGSLPDKGAGKLPLRDTSEKLFFTVERLGVSFEAVGSTPATPSGPLVVSGPCVKLW
jgi:anti-sigma-K factor RskA